MKNFLFLVLLASFVSQYSFCQDTKILDKVQTSNWQNITKDFMTWYNYTNQNIHLSQDFIGVSKDSTFIDKSEFLNELLTGTVFVYKIGKKDEVDIYKLYPLNSDNDNIKQTIKGIVLTEIQHCKMKGTQIPNFSLKDINGNNFDTASTKGKLIVLKCWFIHCVACVKEFPELNKLVEDYKENHNILFISLAMDKKEDLVKFLKTKKFKYATVPNMKDFMINDLNITQYPTHVLIGKDGKILKVTNSIEELIPFIEKASK